MSIEKTIERIAEALESIYMSLKLANTPEKILIQDAPNATEERSSPASAEIVSKSWADLDANNPPTRTPEQREKYAPKPEDAESVAVEPKAEKKYTRSEREAMLEELKRLGVVTPSRQNSSVLAKKLAQARLNNPKASMATEPKPEPVVENDPIAQADPFDDAPVSEDTTPKPLTKDQIARGIEGLRRVIIANTEKLGKDGANNLARNVLKHFKAARVSDLDSVSFEAYIEYLKSKGVKI